MSASVADLTTHRADAFADRAADADLFEHTCFNVLDDRSIAVSDGDISFYDQLTLTVVSLTDIRFKYSPDLIVCPGRMIADDWFAYVEL